MADTKGGCCWLKGDLLKFPPYYVVHVCSKKIVCEMPMERRRNDLSALQPSSAIAQATALATKKRPWAGGATLVSLDLVSACRASVRVPHRVSIRKGSG